MEALTASEWLAMAAAIVICLIGSYFEQRELNRKDGEK